MIPMNFGKHRYKALETMFFQKPDYIYWVLAKCNSGPALEFKTWIKQMIRRFDEAPFIALCTECRKPATCLSVPYNSIDVMYWCEECNPYNQGARAGSLRIIYTYKDAVLHVTRHCSRQDLAQKLIRAMATAKGLPKRFTLKWLESFFGTV